ncbi:MAG: hypothetical protein RLZZ618_1476 [Pseudomonadota bacterium]
MSLDRACEAIQTSESGGAPATAAGASGLPDDLAALRANEDSACKERRREVLGEAASGNATEMGLPRVGLALSGGGVRSATFALGLLRGLAQNRTGDGGSDPARRTLGSDGLLGRIDYLSTVSGGGYTGSMFGRLVSTYGLACAQRLLARSDSPVLQWLRRNGRYLTPSGSRDIGIAVVSYLRAWLAIHTEFMYFCMFLGLLVVAPHLAQHSTLALGVKGWEPWRTPWWPLAALIWVTLAPGLITGYWAARDAPGASERPSRISWRDLACLVVLALVAAGVFSHLWDLGAINLVADSLRWPTAVLFGLGSAWVGQAVVQACLVFRRAPHALTVARLRNVLTRALRAVMLVSVAVAGLGLLDWLSWWVLEELQTGNRWLWGGVGFGGLLVLVLRTLMQPLQSMAAQAGAHARDWLPRFINLASLAGLLALVTAWMVLLQWFIFAPETFEALRTWPAWLRASLIAIVAVVWVGLTAGNAQMANTSSLHSFYRARLTRAYLAVGNRARQFDGEVSHRADVTQVVEGDDTSLEHYRPEAQGGPIHLVSTCLNQTRDDQSGLYNADRKGTALVASNRGLELGPAEFIAHREGQDPGTLGRWVAVSGAAASPGAGAYTSRGLALLVYFLGVRLGHWAKSPRTSVPLRWLSDLGWRCFPKPMMLTSEASATFFGTDRPWWYLSDGGHFDNTGVYALLKRELDFILLSDASCDADYSFADLENLVRKARIDFGAEIDFYTMDEAANLFSLSGSELTVLSPEHLADNHSCRGVLLARIRYRARLNAAGVSHRPEGTLLIVKPNLHDALDVDLLAYAQQHTDFPHESTGDQSFDEAQWESYHRLGEDFGRAMHDTWLTQLPGWRSPARHGLRVAARLGAAVSTEGPKPVPLWRRSARATAIGTTLGLGASGTLLLSFWQMQDQLQRNRSDQQSEARQLFGSVAAGLQKLDGSCPDLSEMLVTQTSLLLELRGGDVLRPLESEGLDRLSSRISQACKKPAAASEDCLENHKRMQNDLCTLVKKTATPDLALNYWNSGTSPGDQARAVTALWTKVRLRWQAAPPVIVALPPQPGDPSVNPQPPKPVLPSLAACERPPLASTLYLQVYDEASRAAATTLRQTLQDAATAANVHMQVAPVENVGRTAELRQRRRPVPWAQPTLIVHDAGGRPCAAALSRWIGLPWVAVGETDKVWVRGLPETLKGQPGTIELWLPPVDAVPVVTSIKAR